MKQLNTFQTIIFQLGGLLMVAGAIMPIIPAVSQWAVVTFTVGALAFGSMQLLQSYDGRSIVIRRLRRQQIIAAFLLMITACLMIMKRYGVGPIPIRGDEWKVTLVVAAILEAYTAFRIPAEVEKEQQH